MDILNSYPLNKTISVKEYLIDFVLRNPLNFPFSSCVMKFCKNLKAGVPIKDYYTKDTIDDCLDKLTDRHYKTVTHYDMISSNNVSFTGLMLMLFVNFYDSKIIIHQNGPDIILSYSDGVHRSIAMIDKSATSLIIYQAADSINIYPIFSGNHWNNLEEISLKVDIAKHYYFKFHESENEIENQLIFLTVLTGNDVPSWRNASLQKLCKYKMKDSIMSNYNILKICSSDFSCISDAAVIKDVSDKPIKHTDTVVDLDVLNKLIA